VIYGDGMALNKDTHFLFNRLNWDEDQVVQIDIRRNASTYQGSSITRFLHTVESEDPNWRSPFLRPMRLTITDDDECPKGAQKYDAVMGGRVIRKCGCQEDYFIKNTDLGYCDTVTRCPKCPEGMACDFQQDARSQQLRRAFTEPKLRHSTS
jgi:hypothetical protein